MARNKSSQAATQAEDGASISVNENTSGTGDGLFINGSSDISGSSGSDSENASQSFTPAPIDASGGIHETNEETNEEISDETIRLMEYAGLSTSSDNIQEASNLERYNQYIAQQTRDLLQTENKNRSPAKTRDLINDYIKTRRQIRSRQKPPVRGLESSQIVFALENPSTDYKVRRLRLTWRPDETDDLLDGCRKYGIGNWKKILSDPSYRFQNRSAVDLKDRFRSKFPKEYALFYPNSTQRKVQANPDESYDLKGLAKVERKKRTQFTKEEDERILAGYLRYGPAWAKIQKDPEFALSHRRSKDLRDRFRNAFAQRRQNGGNIHVASGSREESSSRQTSTSLSPSSSDSSGAVS